MRESNFELLRIIAMMLVLIIHANFIAIGRPTPEVLEHNPLRFVTQFSIESFGIIAVNVFVLISGWFGIRFSFKSFAALMFQVFFYWGIIYCILIFVGAADFSLQQAVDCIGLGTNDQFIKSYICLFILSPVLNAYAEKPILELRKVF